MNQYHGTETMVNAVTGEAKPRITGELMKSFKDKSATIVGDIVKRDAEGKRITIKTTDGCFVQLVFPSPISVEIIPNCVIEAYGMVQNHNVFNCYDYVIFPKEMSEKFDRGLYNDFVAEFIKQSERHFNIERPEDHEGPLITPNEHFSMPEVNTNTTMGDISMND